MIEINIKYRLDFVGLSTDTKPTVQVENGSTYYTVDTQELYVYYAGEWYLQAPIETSSDEETPAENSNEKKEEVKEPVKETIEEHEITLEHEPIEEPIEKSEPVEEPTEEPIENPESVEEKKSGDEK